MRGIGYPHIRKIVTIHAAFPKEPVLSKICYWGDKTIAVSEDLRGSGCDLFGIPAECISVIPNGIDVRRYAPVEKSPPAGSILFASRLDKDCSLGAILLCRILPSLVKSYPRLHLKIAGGGDALEAVRREAKKVNLFCESQGLPPAAELLGWVEDLSAEYGKNRIFVGVSRAALEAAACGCGVILCGNEGRGGYLTPENRMAAVTNFCCRGQKLPDEEWLEKQLRFLLEHETFCDSMGKRGSDYVRAQFGGEQMAQATLQVYRS